jgi:hypothetical protein
LVLLVATAGVVDVLLRMQLVGPGNGLLFALRDPGKTLFHVVLLPFALGVFLTRFDFAVLARCRKIALPALGLALASAALVVVNEAHQGLCGDRLPAPADVGEPALRSELALLHLDDWRTARPDLRAEYLGLAPSGAAECRPFADSSPRWFWSNGLTFLGVLFVGLVMACILAAASAPDRLTPEHYSTIAILVPVLALWIPLRTFSEWVLNFGEIPASVWITLVLATMATVAVALWLAIVRYRTWLTERAILLITTFTGALVTVVGWLRPQLFEAAALLLMSMNAIQWLIFDLLLAVLTYLMVMGLLRPSRQVPPAS